MNVINFQPFDYTYGLNNLRSQNEKLMDSVNQNLSQGIENYDTWAKEKKKWDAMMEDQAYFKGQHDNAIAGRDKYLESQAKQAELQRQIDEADMNNAAIQEQIDQYATYPVGIYKNDAPTVEAPAASVDPLRARLEKSNASVDGLDKSGLYYGSKFMNTNAGEDGSNTYNPYMANLRSKLVDVYALQAQLDAEKKNGAQYENDYNNAAMYEDPRFAVALRKARTDMDPAAVYNYMSTWMGEGATRDAKRLQAANMSTMENMKAIIGERFSDEDFAKYGRNAQIAYMGMMNAQDPSTFNSYLGMFNNIITSKDASDRIYSETEKTKMDDDRYLLMQLENSIKLSGKKPSDEAWGQFELQKKRFKDRWGVDYDSNENVGLAAGLEQGRINEAAKLEKKRDYNIRYNNALNASTQEAIKFILSNNPSADLNLPFTQYMIEKQKEERMNKKGFTYKPKRVY